MKTNKSDRKEFVRRYWSLHENREMTFHEVMVDMYITKEMSMRDIGIELCCSLGIVHKWLVDEGIPGRKIKFL